MANTLAITRSVVDGTTYTASQNNTQCTDVETFLNTTKLTSDNIQTGGITSDSLAASAVTSAKLSSGSVTTAALGSDVNALLTPTGMVSPYAGVSAPTGWLLCNGSAISRTVYSALFNVVSTYYGSGDGSTTFNIPDLRGRFVRGFDSTAGRDPDSASRTAMNSGGNTGNNIGSVQAGATARSNTAMTATTSSDGDHTHTVSPLENIGDNTTVSGALGIYRAAGSTTTSSNGAHTHTVSISGGGDNETRPLNASLNYIIKI